ncbi:hypothetical protein V6N12_067333 [Hibiscus sabdariffa]|uniref:Uncharacterized protein n=1 Tax=Hibiscus sabdariffa TaxID=183260 RepID=A0ABR2BE22_9ROSI
MLHNLRIEKSPTLQPIRILSDPSTSSKESVPETTVNPERKRPCSSGSDGNGDVQVKEEHASSLMKKSNAVCSGSVLKTRKKPRFVVHAAGDGGQSQVTSTRRSVGLTLKIDNRMVKNLMATDPVVNLVSCSLQPAAPDTGVWHVKTSSLITKLSNHTRDKKIEHHIL